MSGIVLENKWGKDPTHLTIGVSILTWAGELDNDQAYRQSYKVT